MVGIRSIFNIFILVVVLALIGMIPWVDGYFFKQNYLEMIAAWNKDNQTNIQVKNYTVGWLGSHVEIYVQPTNAKLKSTAGLTIEQDISHGPYAYDSAQDARVFALATIHSSITLPEALKRIASNQSGQSDVNVNTIVSFSNDYESQLMMPSFVVAQNPFPFKLTTQGLTGNISLNVVDDHVNHIVSNMTMGPIAAQNDNFAFNLKDVFLQHDLTRNPIGLWVGTYAMSTPGFTLSGASGPLVSVSKLDSSVKSNVNEQDFYNSELQLSVGTLVVSDITINSSTFKITESNFSAKGIVNLLHAAADLKSGMIAPDQYPQFVALLPGVIAPTSVINENIAIITSSGKFTSTGQVYWPANVSTLKADDLLMNTNFKVTLRMSSSLVNQLIGSMYGAQQPGAETAVTDNASQPTESGLLSQIDLWVTQNKISIYISYQLKDLIHAHLPGDAFATNIDPFVIKKDIPQDVADQLKARYEVLFPTKTKDKKNPLAPVIVQAPPPPQPQPQPQQQLSPADKMKNQINDWIKQGLITQDQDDYVTTITREQGVIKFNGLSVNTNTLPGL